MGDGELYEGAVWEAMMLAGQYKLDNLILIIDNNKISMLDYCKNIIDLEPLEEKFLAFKWKVSRIDGHNLTGVYGSLKTLKENENELPESVNSRNHQRKGRSAIRK